MSKDRPPARSKRTRTGKIMGRPVGPNGVPALETAAPAMKLQCTHLRQPAPVEDPITGEMRRAFGPGVPVYEWREVRRGRPALSTQEEILRIIQAQGSLGRKGFARKVADDLQNGITEAFVKRRLRMTRSQIRDGFVRKGASKISPKT